MHVSLPFLAPKWACFPQWILLHSLLSSSGRCWRWAGVFSHSAGGAGRRQRVPAAGLHVHLLPPSHAPDSIWRARRCHLSADGACRWHLPSIYSQVRMKTKAEEAAEHCSRNYFWRHQTMMLQIWLDWLFCIKYEWFSECYLDVQKVQFLNV